MLIKILIYGGDMLLMIMDKYFSILSIAAFVAFYVIMLLFHLMTKMIELTGFFYTLLMF
jgi:hypothetical protein